MYPYPPYPPPYPAYGPPYVHVPPAPPTPRTPVGLRWAVVSLSFVVAYFAASAVFALAVAAAFGGPLPETPPQVSGFLSLASAAAIVPAILGLLGLGFYVVAFGYLYVGRNEFGPAHARNARIALVLLLVVLGLGFASVLTSWILGGMGVRFANGTWALEGGMYYLAAVVNAVLGIVVAALVAAHLVLSVRALVKPRHGTVLYAAAALGTATPGIAGSLTLLQMPQFLAFVDAVLEVPGQQGSPGLDPGLGLPAVVAGALGVLTFLLFLWAYWGAGARIRAGDLKPILPPQAPAMPWPPPMMPTYPWPYATPGPVPQVPPGPPPSPPP